MEDHTHADLIWKIIPTQTPAVYRRCPRCGIKQRFISSDKFRMNSNHHRLDIWLIYKCNSCDSTWNCTIFSRITLDQLDRDLYDRFIQNDQHTAWQYAFDYELLKRNQAVYETKVDYVVEGKELDIENTVGKEVRVLITFVFAINIRLESLISSELRLTRGQLQSLIDKDALWIDSKKRVPLAKNVKQDVVVVIEVDALRALKTGENQAMQ